MAHTPHELTEDFSEFADKISALKQSDAHFAKLADAYHDTNRQVHRAETDVEPMSDEQITTLRRTRMSLKDEIAAYLRKDGQSMRH